LICSTCPFSSSNAVSDGYNPNGRFDEHCIMCGCTITRKTSSLSANCGIDCCNANSLSNCDCKKKSLKEYNKKNQINLPLKWLAYKKETNEQQ
jgi:hypothetical protein